jgi:hypothetical protein
MLTQVIEILNSRNDYVVSVTTQKIQMKCMDIWICKIKYKYTPVIFEDHFLLIFFTYI